MFKFSCDFENNLATFFFCFARPILVFFLLLRKLGIPFIKHDPKLMKIRKLAPTKKNPGFGSPRFKTLALEDAVHGALEDAVHGKDFGQFCFFHEFEKRNRDSWDFS